MNKLITIDQVQRLSPCYNPRQYGLEEATLLDVLRNEDIPAEDRLWVVVRFLDDKTNRLFAVWCAREALKLVDSPDPRSVAACGVAERYANGEATEEELDVAEGAAARAAWATDWATARAAARTAARAATWAATRAAWAAARDAVWAAARAAEAATGDAAWSIAREATWDKQVQQLIKMIGE